ncbi:MAG: cellulase family glycosylhydrolase [Chitinispirillaceae bacterium]|nr:cellulase family glycosylhydrolase [Chitinispirillaceae bacterium]
MITRTFSEGKIRCLVFIMLLVALPGSYNLYAQGVAYGPMRNLTRRQVVWDMKIGWNLGNTMDAPTETGWGNPVTTQAMIDAVKAMGFKTMRLPVTWNGHFGAAPSYTIVQAWLDRVETIANYALRDSMYVIINTHHDSTQFPLMAADSAVARDKLAKIWTQIATRFRDYGDYVIFETLNEPRGPVNLWNGGNDQQRGILNAYHLAAVNAIRATGGNNAKRFIMCCTHSACPLTVAINGLVIPNNDTNVLVSLHTYYPQGFCLPPVTTTTWGSSADSANVRSELNRELADVTAKGSVAVIGEWASPSACVLASRVAHACYYAQQVRLRGMLPVWWDDGGDFEILNRTSNPVSWTYLTIAQALCNCASSVTATAPEPPGENKNPPYGLMERAGVISYSLPGAATVSLRVYTLQGKIAATLVRSVQSAGDHQVKLPAKSMASGNYILEFKVGNNSVSRYLAWFR